MFGFRTSVLSPRVSLWRLQGDLARLHVAVTGSLKQAAFRLQAGQKLHGMFIRWRSHSVVQLHVKSGQGLRYQPIRNP